MCVVHGTVSSCLHTFSQLADWLKTDLHLIIRWVSVGSCFCLLILSFTYNRHVLFTNRIQNSRRFIMLLRCVLTNAGCRLRWLPQCRLLPGLEHAACPAAGGTHTHTLSRKQKWVFRLCYQCNLVKLYRQLFYSKVKNGCATHRNLLIIRRDIMHRWCQQMHQTGIWISMIIVINDVNKGLIWLVIWHNPKAQLETRFRRNLDVILFHLFFYSLFLLYECILGMSVKMLSIAKLQVFMKGSFMIGGVKRKAQGPELAWWRLQSGPLDGFGNCEGEHNF